MITSEHSYPTTESPRYPNATQKQEHDLKYNLIWIIKVFKEGKNKSSKVNKSVKDLKVKTETMKNLQNFPVDGKLRVDNNNRYKHH